ncbi:MAG: DUF4386 domain-containing protein [Hyphomonadaceae bacterium]|nr:DUF4386 domain-containing protein [Hyphomonadaceae bacterium]
MSTSRPVTGLSAIALAILFNAPFSILAATYDYPDILRRPAGEALEAFTAGGSALILTWHAFALCALALAPLAIAVSITPRRITEAPALAIGAAILGALSGLAQAIGLWRWVFVVPVLARTHADPQASGDAQIAAERAFAELNQYGGVAIGEHLGQWLLALFVLCVALLQWREKRRISGALGFVTSIVLLVGTTEGLAIALGQPGEIFAMATIGGFLGLTIWLIATGVGLIRGEPV